jgi:D-3-phosphoglycerate dehydrogenase
MTNGIIAISTSSFGDADAAPLDRLSARGYTWRLNPHGRQLTEAEAIAHTRGAVGLVAGTEKLTAAVLRELPGLKVVSRVGAGIDNVDLDAAASLGIAVRSTPDAHVDAVAELALAGILASLRRLGPADRGVRGHGWRKPMGSLLRGRTVGVVGFGRVGRAVAALLAPFGVTLLAFDPAPDAAAALALGARYVALDELLRASDVVTLHVPYGRGVHHLIGARELDLMKPDALIANTARGGLIDEEALAAHLAANRGALAYLDCFEREPYTGPLATSDQVLCTPHIGSYAREARLRMEAEAVENLLSVLDA